MSMIDETKAKIISEEDRKEAEECLKRVEGKASERMTWENHWQEALDVIIPRKNDVITTYAKGQKRNTNLFDTTAIQANQLLAAALHSMLTNPSVRFLEFYDEDDRINDMDEVRAWNEDTAERIFKMLNQTNFQTEVHETYLDLGAIGTGPLYMGEHEERVMHFSARAIKEIFIEENNEGLVDTVYRCFKWKPRQMVQEFGAENLPREVLKAYNTNPELEFEIIHYTYPYSEEEASERGGVYKIGSKYVLKEPATILVKGGYHEQPYTIPRWSKSSGEVYGRGPGMHMLPDIKMVNKMMETTLKGAQKTVDPPMMVSDDGVIGSVRLTPGGLTVVRPTTEVPIRPLIIDARIDFGMQLIQSVQEKIKAGFFVDQLKIREGDRMTTVEVNQRIQENLRFMGPVLGRLHFEFLSILADRCFGIMWRRKLFAPVPSVLSGRRLHVRFKSLLARSQKIQEGEVVNRAIASAAPLFQIDPSVVDNIKLDDAAKYIMVDLHGFPQKLIRGERERDGIRKSRAEQQAQQMQMMQEQHQAEVANKVAPVLGQVAKKGE